MEYYKNPEIKGLTIKIILFIVLILISILAMVKIEVNNLNKSYIKQNTIIAGNILLKHPELESEIISALTTNNEENYNLGKEILSKYHYKESIEVYKNVAIYNFSTKFVFKCILGMLISIGILYLVILKDYIEFYKKAQKFSMAAEDIVEGRFKDFRDINREGDFFVLAAQFNLMANSQRESLEKLKKERLFLKNTIADISHQLKTPLFSLIMFNDLMNNENTPRDDMKNFLKLSDEQLRRMEWLIINLLKMARLDAKVVEFKIENNPLNLTISEALSGIKEKSKEKNQNIIIENIDNVYFKHDSKWTAEALTNIIKNCIEHTGKNGEIKISCEETPISLTINIKDDGEGIPSNIIGNIFKRFYKGESSTNPCSIGIGLALSKSIIESQNGIIRVESEVGIGTKFIITFLKTII